MVVAEKQCRSEETKVADYERYLNGNDRDVSQEEKVLIAGVVSSGNGEDAIQILKSILQA